ncbi:T9SS type A sorting domain-containing protein [candidate division KSB1 bacterium]|nr:T9SS type A sorting domain-containing protein [candidate division KSB1 bacterium]
MKTIVTALTVVSSFVFLTSALSAQDRFDRSAEIPAQPDDVGGFGNVVGGVDFDGDGKTEIYAVNNDWKDEVGKDLVPRVYKYEKNDQGQWEIVWWTRLALDFQNTWPAMAAADLDQDGKQEIVWGPVNNLAGGQQPNPERIVVFETVGDGSDIMGIDNGDGTYSPNAQWTIVEEDDVELRPFRWFINDIDGDGVDEIVTIIRSGSPVVQVYSTDDVPDNGDGSETWTREFAGGGEAQHWDLTIVDSTIYAIAQSGDVTPITYSASGDSFRVGTTQVGVVPNGSWKSAVTVDIDDDGTEEILVASWLDNAEGKRVWLLQQDADTLSRTQIADFSAFPDIRRLNGADFGDVDADGNIDYIIGTRDFDTPPGDMNAIARVEYLGGDITNPANYEASVIDQNVIAPQGSQADVVFVTNLDDDPEDEILFAGETRPFGSGPPVLPISVLEKIPGNQPKITDVVDVPNDNGRQVRVDWLGAEDDNSATTGAVITEYTVWRRVDPSLAKSGLEGTGTGKIIEINQAEYEQVGSTKAIQNSEYSLTVPTLVDRVEGSEDPGLSSFIVFAHTADPLVNWASFSESGFSVDNLIPTAPSNVIASEGQTAEGVFFAQITWDESPDPDFNFFTVLRGTESGFDPEAAEVLGTTTETTFIDDNVTTGETFFYRIFATDFNNNEGELSEEVSLVITSVEGDVPSVPEEFALHQNYPNPFNPATNIAYDVPKSTDVTLKIYNMMGQEVKTLVDENQPAGQYTVQWDATNNFGTKVSSGLYVYVIKAGDFVKSNRMTLLK